MWIKFTRDIGNAKAGSYADVEAPIAQNYITLGVAEAAPDDPAQRAAAMVLHQVQPLIQAQADSARAAQAREQIAAPLVRPRTVVGNDGASATGGLEYHDLDTSPMARALEARRRRPSFYVRSVIDALGNPDVEARTKAHEELVRPWNEGGYGCTRAMAEGAGSTGGYTTPVLFESQVYEVMGEEQVIVPFADERPLGARQVEWPALNQYSAPVAGQSAWYGGIKVYRKGENTQRTESDLGFKKIQMLAQDLTAYTELSRDLVQDSPGVDSYVVRAIGGAIGWREDWESINGNGAGQFLGYQVAPASLLVARFTAGHIVYQDLLAMKARFRMRANANACWIVHPYALPEIEGMTDSGGRLIYLTSGYTAGAGNTAAGVPGPGGTITYRPAGALLGWPIYTSEKIPALGGTGDLSLLNRKSYWVGRRSGLEIGLSEHFRFDTDELAIRAKIRNDGKPGQIAPYYLADGSQTNQVSEFVLLGPH